MFITRIASYYIEHLSEQALQTCIVIPNKRAKAGIRKAIVKALPTGGFLPSLLTMDEFVESQMQGVRLDTTDLCYQLYDSFCQTHQDIAFDEFLSYAHILLHDFNDIDMQLANATEIFSYLSDAKAIQLWNPTEGKLSEAQQAYLNFYRTLSTVYQNFTTQLKAQQAWYRGMGYRQVAEQIQTGAHSLPWQHVFFAGFGLLSKAEEKIIQQLLSAKIAHCLWHIDNYYLKDELMEAGQMFRAYSQWHPELPSQAVNQWLYQAKTVNVLGSPGQVAQLRLLAQNLNPKANTRHVVVLPDEQLLLPLLNSLPQEILSTVNIGMGYPLSHTQTYRLLDTLCRLHLHIAKQTNNTATNYRLPTGIVQEVLHNPLLIPIIDNKIQQASIFRFASINQADLQDTMRKYKATELMFVFDFTDDTPLVLVNQLIRLLEHLFHKKHSYSTQEADAERQLYPILRRLQHLLTQHQQPTHLTAFYLLFKQLTNTLKQQFDYRADAKIQLMRLEDTRLFGFEEVSVLSLNEDSLPRPIMPTSFVPLDIKHLFGLSAPRAQMAAQAYDFYSLLQGASSMHLYYSTTTGKLSGGEPSRFLKQLDFEWRHQAVAPVQWKNQLLSFEHIPLPQPTALRFEKDATMLAKLKTLAERGLSPTSISTFIRCPIQFCLRYVWGFQPPEEPEETIDIRLMGNVIHKVLEDIYRPYLGKDFPAEHYAHILKTIPKSVQAAYATETNADISHGYNYLTLKNTEYYLQRFLKHEQNLAKQNTLRILEVEKPLSKTISLNIGNETWDIKIKGIADRIDEYAGQKRILDYKTGTVDTAKLKAHVSDYKEEQLEAIFTHPDYAKMLQLFIYDWMSKAPEDPKPSATGIVSLKKVKEPYIMVNFPPAHSELYQTLEAHFQTLLSRIFDPNIPFEHAADTEPCPFCDNGICL